MRVVKSKISDLFLIIGYIIVIPILILNISIIYKTIKYPNKIPDVFGYKFFIVLSDSMETTIEKGDLVVVKMVDSNTLDKNDIIAFRFDNFVVTHRIVKVNLNEQGEKYFVTKGDNFNTEDNDIVLNYNIEGLLVKKYSGLGNILLFIASPMGSLIIILSILLIFFMGDYIYRDKENKKDEEELI